MSLTYRSRINGAIDTGQSVLENINKMATSAGCFVSWDPSQGKWHVIINDYGSSIFSFNDSNIVGPITMATADLDQIYNRVTVQFPHQDLRSSIDTITYRIPDSDRYNGETDNPMNINLELCNDPAQAALIAARELKQSRVDKTITFTADYTANGLVAGELVDVTNSAYGFTNKTFRVIAIDEIDGPNGELLFGITAIEYDPAVYSTSGLVREERNTETDIKPSVINQCILDEDGNEILSRITDKIDDFANLGFTPIVDSFVTGSLTLTADSITPATNPSNSSVTLRTYDIGRSFVAPYTGTYKIEYFANWASNISVNFFDRPPMGIVKVSGIRILVNGSPATIIGLGSVSQTGDSHVQILEDHVLENNFSANKDDIITYQFDYLHNLNPGDNIAPVGYPTYTVPVGAAAGVVLAINLTYLGR